MRPAFIGQLQAAQQLVGGGQLLLKRLHALQGFPQR
jgi:hypothetical protein